MLALKPPQDVPGTKQDAYLMLRDLMFLTLTDAKRDKIKREGGIVKGVGTIQGARP